ncbi:MAG: hypothetical protein NVS3B20_01450 [Polyangiales bacterium]
MFPSLVLLSLLAHCLSPASDRTALDLSVGNADTGDAQVQVEDGLATVQVTGPHAMKLWAQAPALRVHLATKNKTDQNWRITIDNCLVDATLQASSTNGSPRAVDSRVSDIPTEKIWIVSVPGGGETVLTVGATDANRRAAQDRFRIALLSDIQEAIDRVQDIFRRINDDPSIRFVVSAGDLTDHGRADEFERFQRELRSLRVPFYATLGNHDIATSESLFRDYFGRGNFRFSYRSVQFTFIDSASATVDEVAYQWLDRWLHEGRAGVHVVTMHIPPLDPVGTRNASFASRNESGKLLSRLARGKVDVTLYGHIHSYYAFSNAGIPAIISGGGGAHPERMDGIGRHYVTVDLNAAGVIETGLVRID